MLDDASTDQHPRHPRRHRTTRASASPAAPQLPAGWSDKQHACHILGSLARHDLMVFVDADVRLGPDALSRMAGFMQRHEHAGLASGFPRQVTRHLVRAAAAAADPLPAPRLPAHAPSCAPACVAASLGAGCGQLFIVRRDAYRATGGHAAIRASLHDGLTLPRAFRRAGHRSLLFDATAFARCRMYANAAQVWEGLCKNATEGMAKPRALPIWTIILAGGSILPAVLVAVAPSIPAWAALICAIETRLLLAARFRQPILSALLHPAGILALLIIQWFSLIRAARGGRATWRGRAYPAQ